MDSTTSDAVYEINKMASPTLQLAIIIMGVFMAILDTSVVNVAIPAMETAMNASTDQIQWVVTGYMLVLGVLIPTSGWLTDRFGPKKIFLFSLATFTAGSALCGMAWNLSSIIGFRVLQGMGGALMQPVAMAMIFRIFPPNRRGAVMGVLGIAMMGAPAFGPALSGYLVDYWSWRFIFYINVPIGVVAVVLGSLKMHEFSHQPRGSFDVWGFAFTVIGFGSILYGFSQAASYGWHSTHVIPYLVAGILGLITLVVIELRIPHPMIQLRVFRNYMFSMSMLLISIISVALFAGVFFLPLYMQNIRGYTAVRTGLFMTPAALVAAVIMPFSGRLFDRIGARPLGIVGMAIVTLASLGFTSLGLDTPGSTIQYLYMARSFGLGIAMMPVMTAGMNTVPFELTSQGTAVSSTLRQVTSSLGTAVLTTYMTSQANKTATQLATQVTPGSYPGLYLQHLQTMFQGAGMSIQAAQQGAVAMMNGLIQQNAFLTGMNDAFMVAALLCGLSVVFMFFYASAEERAARERRQQHPGAGPAPAPIME